jgi:glycosyltransferase involved in cell wall biosynthesis
MGGVRGEPYLSTSLRLAIPGPLDQATGGYRYAAAMVAAWRRQGHRVAVDELAGTYPLCDGAALKAAKACLARTRASERLLIDGLALPAFDGLALPKRTLALIHHPLGLETGLEPAVARAWLGAETARLAKIAAIVATSAATRRDLVAMGVDGAKIAIVEPGTAAARTPLARRGKPRALCVATLTPRKDHVALLRALARVRDVAWRADFVGSTERDPACAARVRAEIARLRLGHRVRLAGTCSAEALHRHYASAHLFALASRHEGYGMAFAEALAHRLPVVGVAAGAVPSVVPTHAGILVPPGQVDMLARALRRMLGPQRRRHAQNAAALRFPDWPQQAARLWASLP